MKVTSKAIGPCRLQLSIQADAGETRGTYEKVLQLYHQQGRVPGFRPGKAPQEVILRHYQEPIIKEARERLIGECYRKAIRDEQIDAVAVLGIDELSFSPTNGISFIVKLDVPPDFKLPRYKGLALTDETPVVGDEQVDERLEQIRRMLGRYEPVADQPVGEGDAVRVSYSARLDDQPLTEILPENAKHLATDDDAWLQADDKVGIPGLGSALVGMQPDETKTVDVTFPADYVTEALAGKTVAYTVVVHEIRRQVLPELDEEFFKRVGAENETVLREGIRKDLEQAAEHTELRRRRDAVAQALLRKSNFDLPESVVQEETRVTLQSIIQDALRQGAGQDALKENRDALLQSAQNVSEERVRLNYILLRIAAEEGIEVGEDEVEDRIAYHAQRQRTTPAKLREHLEKSNAIERLSSEIRAQKAMDLVLVEAKIS